MTPLDARARKFFVQVYISWTVCIAMRSPGITHNSMQHDVPPQPQFHGHLLQYATPFLIRTIEREGVPVLPIEGSRPV